MSSPKLYALLKKIHEQTQIGRVKWQTTLKDDTFRLGLGTGIIRFEKKSVYDEDRHEEVDGYRVTLMDKNGKRVEELWDYEPLNEPNVFLRDFFSDARSSALNVDEILNSMYEDLEAGKTQVLPPEDATF